MRIGIPPDSNRSALQASSGQGHQGLVVEPAPLLRAAVGDHDADRAVGSAMAAASTAWLSTLAPEIWEV